MEGGAAERPGMCPLGSTLHSCVPRGTGSEPVLVTPHSSVKTLTPTGLFSATWGAHVSAGYEQQECLGVRTSRELPILVQQPCAHSPRKDGYGSD